MNIYVRKVASEGINHHVEHCIFVPASRVLFSSRCPTFRVSLLSSSVTCDMLFIPTPCLAENPASADLFFLHFISRRLEDEYVREGDCGRGCFGECFWVKHKTTGFRREALLERCWGKDRF